MTTGLYIRFMDRKNRLMAYCKAMSLAYIRGTKPEAGALLSNAKIVEQIGLAPQMLRELLAEMAPERMKQRPSADKWSAHEHAAHLGAVDRLFVTRLDLMLAEQEPVLVPYVPPADDEAGALLMQDLGRVLDSFEDGRERLVQRLRSLNDRQWELPAKHPEYRRYNVRIMFRHAVLHDMLHCYRIEELLLKKDWT